MNIIRKKFIEWHYAGSDVEECIMIGLGSDGQLYVRNPRTAIDLEDQNWALLDLEIIKAHPAWIERLILGLLVK